MKISVKELAEFVHRRGDLHTRYQSATLAHEGIARQKAWQRDRGDGYRREYAVTAEFGDLVVSGRIDGWDPAARQVDEIKTTRMDPAQACSPAQEGDVHWAQLRLYGGLLVLGDHAPGTTCEGADAGASAADAGASATDAGASTADADPPTAKLHLRLIYLHPEDPAETILEETWQCDQLIAFFETTCACYAAWLADVTARLDCRSQQLRELRFPYPNFRADQRRLAKHVYRGFRDDVHWLVEAPTGSGKTMASVFPALKAMGEGQLDRLVFATSRTTGQVAAETAVAVACDGIEDARGSNGEGEGALIAVTITAKARICFNPDLPCDPQRCQYARGYYDRMPAARRELLGRRQVRRQPIEAVALRHGVCPFELSLDTAAWADIVICDYNYVFDPIVRLQRLANEAFTRVGLIVDEAHQLGDRVRDMLGARLPRAAVKAALGEANVPAEAAKAFRSVDRALANLARDVREVDAADELEVDRPAALGRALERLATRLPPTNLRLDEFPAAAEAYWLSSRFHRALAWAQPGAFRYLTHGRRRTFEIEIACTLPGEHIQTTLKTYRGSARLSGTLAPNAVFQRIHGFAEDAPFVRSEGCFGEDRLGAFVVPDLSTYYRDRHRTLLALSALIESVGAATPGNCLVAFPSFEYLQAVADIHDSACVRCQTPAMSLAEREDFVAWLGAETGGVARSNTARSGTEDKRVGLVVTGGLFAESVDFDSRALRSVVVVGPSLPPRSLRRDLIAEDSAANGERGDEIAYRQPAMTRVAQVVGRIARGDQRGVAVLVDPRFRSAAYRAFLPPWWRLRTIPSVQAAAAVARFWQGRYQPSEPASPLNGPTTSAVAQPP